MIHNKKQTATEWLIEDLIERDLTKKDDHIKTFIYKSLEQAKENEKDKMIEFAKYCLDKALDLDVRTAYASVENYYNQTYEKK